MLPIKILLLIVPKFYTNILVAPCILKASTNISYLLLKKTVTVSLPSDHQQNLVW